MQVFVSDRWNEYKRRTFYKVTEVQSMFDVHVGGLRENGSKVLSQGNEAEK